MKTYIELIIENISAEQSDILIAFLSENGFDGFEENNENLKAFTNREDFDEEKIKTLSNEFYFRYSFNKIDEQNWNALWESNFEPVTVDDFVTVRANFHQPNSSTQHEILITPKMSFGTGHHATTFMMMQQMRALDFKNKSVFDFGTGTGVLAILAEKSGAAEIIAIDNDDRSVENAKENIEANNAYKIEIIKNDTASSEKQFDVVLANINKNVILDNAETLYNALNKTEGYLLLSGLLTEDEVDILKTFSAFGLRHLNTQHRAQWISMLWQTK